MNIFLNRIFFVVFFLLGISQTLEAQIVEKKSFLSKVYFPFEFGKILSNEPNLRSSEIARTGIEYRPKHDRGIFFRFDYVNRNSEFDIQNNSLTNVKKGKLNFNDYTLGLGFRKGSKKIKGILVFKGGISSYNYPVVSGTQPNYDVQTIHSTSPIFKSLIGIEYYISENAAFVLCTDYTLLTKETSFWGKRFNGVGISFGLTTTLF